MSRPPCIWVTRPDPEARSTSMLLEGEGYRVRTFSLLINQPIELNLRHVIKLDSASYQCVAITSAQAIPALLEAPEIARLPIAALGTASAAKLRAQGLDPTYTAESNVASLVELLAARLPPGSRVLYLRGRHVSADFASALRERGLHIDEAVIYDMQPVASLPTSLVAQLTAGDIDAAVAYSRRSLSILEGLMAKHALEDGTRRMALVCLSPDIAQAATPGLWEKVCPAGRPRDSAVLDTFKRLYGQPPRITT